VVTTIGPDGANQGMTVSAFSSVSLDPPLVLICIEKTASAHEALSSSRGFVINILSADQEHIARRFSIVDIDRFEGIGYSRSGVGYAVLDDVLSVIECSTFALHEAGDHTIIVGRVETANAHNGSPLLYYRGGYAQLGP
jgi:flavin reductase (DIM6/NTAB) family NADH-FMN oxidoreductase RutF